MKGLIAFIVCCFCLQTIFAQEFPSLKFSHITEKEGLSNNDIHAITQDRQGFIWVATNDGLNRLDGYRIKTFYHHPNDSNSLVNNSINDITIGNNNNIWIATVEGISCYNEIQNRFINFQHKENDKSSLAGDDSRALYFNNDAKELLVSVPNVLYSFNETFQYKAFPFKKEHLPSSLQLAPVHYLHMYEDRQRQLWTSFANWVFKLDKKTKKIIDSFHTPQSFIQAVFEDNRNQYWVGTYGEGLTQFNMHTRAFNNVKVDGDPSVVYGICAWKDKNNFEWLVVGTNRGVVLVNPKTLQSKLYAADVLNENSITQGDITCLFVDRQNILWIGTQTGLSYIEPSKQLIEAWDITTTDYKLKTNLEDYVYCFFEDSDICYAGNWSKSGLFEYNKSGKLINIIPNVYPQANSFLQGITVKPYAILKLNDDKFLFSVEAGIVEYSMKNKNSILNIPSNSEFTPGFRTICKYDDSTYWIRTRNNGPNGIYVYNTNQKKFTQHYFYTPGCKDCLPSNVRDLIITKDKNVYATPENHYLYVFNKTENKFSPFFISAKQMAQFPSKSFDCMAEDSSGNLWIGTSSGLFGLNVKTKTVIKDFSKDEKLGGISVEELCFDDDKNLWMNTERGLFCLTNATHEIFNFNTGDGLPNNSLAGFLYKGMNGYMYAGALNYIIRFKPAELLHRQTSATIRLSEVTVMNKPYAVTVNSDNKKQIKLKPGENIFTVDFSVLNYDNAAGNLYYYTINGLMNDWKQNENGHLSFYNLPPGEYLLHVKGGDKYGNKFSGEDEIFIDVLPHWWQTLWFYLLLALVSGLITYLLVRRRIKTIRKEASLKTKIAETEMIALRAQMNPHFIFNCMNIIDALITENRKEEAKNFLQKFSRLVRLVLENSQHQLVPLNSDLKALELYTEMEAIRYNHRFVYQFNIDHELIDDNYKIPPLLLQPYIENAIIHGLRHKENGIGKLEVNMKNENGKLLIIIRDNGIGRKRSAEINKENRNPHQQIGMKVTEKRIELLKSMSPETIKLNIIDVNSEDETGTIVHLILPLEFDME